MSISHVYVPDTKLNPKTYTIRLQISAQLSELLQFNPLRINGKSVSKKLRRKAEKPELANMTIEWDGKARKHKDKELRIPLISVNAPLDYVISLYFIIHTLGES